MHDVMASYDRVYPLPRRKIIDLVKSARPIIIGIFSTPSPGDQPAGGSSFQLRFKVESGT